MESSPERLEAVRDASGLSLRGFWERLRESGYEISYSGVHNYHTERPAPADYYVAVAKVFGVDLKWLITGEGSMYGEAFDMAPPDPMIEEVDEILADALPWWDALRPWSQGPLWEVVEELHRRGQGRSPKAVAKELRDAFLAPLRFTGSTVADLNPRELEQYLALIGQAMLLVVRK